MIVVLPSQVKKKAPQRGRRQAQKTIKINT